MFTPLRVRRFRKVTKMLIAVVTALIVLAVLLAAEAELPKGRP